MPGTARGTRPARSVQSDRGAAEVRRCSCASCVAQFGNLGLAAAAYRRRAPRLVLRLARRQAVALPRRDAAARARRSRGPRSTNGRRKALKGASPAQPKPGCRQLMAMLKRAPNPVHLSSLSGTGQSGSPSRLWGVQLSAGFSSRPARSPSIREDRKKRASGGGPCGAGSKPAGSTTLAQPRHSARSIRCASVPIRARVPTPAPPSGAPAEPAWSCATPARRAETFNAQAKRRRSR